MAKVKSTSQKSKFKPIIGLEVHVELKTRSKMFCGCSADHFSQKPNIHVCPVCLGLPGALPVPNQKAIEWCLLAGLALNCQIPLLAKFDRKNYFYPDLPKGYQISQYDQPFCQKGWLKIGERKIGITRVHLEEDTAKMIHRGRATLIDFNRSGVALMEIVSEPELHSPLETKVYLKKLQQIIRYLGISDADMEKGSMRCEANISLKEPPDRGSPCQGPCQGLPSYKIEIKNLNSFRFVEKALAYEIERQRKALLAGEKLVQETRGWDEKKGRTFSQRLKETAADYRYFPEPDIPAIKIKNLKLKISKACFLAGSKIKNLPELPDQKIRRFIKDYGLLERQAEILTVTRQRADYFEEAVKIAAQYQLAAAKIAKVMINQKINLQRCLPAALVQSLVKKKTTMVNNAAQIQKWVEEIIKNHPQPVLDYQRGKEAALEFLIGQVQRLAQGKADAVLARESLVKSLRET